MNSTDSVQKKIPCVIGLSETEAMKRLLSAGALVTCTKYSSKKGVEDADDIRVIRQNSYETAGEMKVALILSPCKTQVSFADNIEE